jgi:hypothetical protein
MRLDTVTAEIRPRSDWEAVDLGLALVRRDFWRCFSVWWLAVLLPTVVVGVWLWDSPLLWLVLFWWWKPAGSRMVLFELSRRLFGEVPAWRTSLREIPRAWTRRFFYRFLWARFSPWLPVTLAVEDLEGLRGKSYRLRSAQVTRRGEGVIMWIYFVADLAAFWFGLAIVVLLLLFIPEGQDGGWRMAIEMWDPEDPASIPLLITRAVAICMMISISLTDLFVIGAGFGIYLNNRTWIEGWDVELAFKRLARRLTKTAIMLLLLLSIAMPGLSKAQAERNADPAAEIREVKAAPEFKVHKVTDRVPKPWSWNWPDWLNWLKFGSLGGSAALLGQLFVISACALLLGLIVWLIWMNRHAFGIRRIAGREPEAPAAARVVMGMEVSPETLPSDVPSAAWELWRQGKHQEALGLLYRGAISKVIEIGRVEIQESDTEGDCVRRVDQAGQTAHPEYFRGITGAWIRMAYAGTCPDDREVESLCRQWPFAERRTG